MNTPARLGEAKLSQLLMEFSVPAIIGMVVNALYNVIDRIFIGNSAGSLGIAGITVGFPLMLIQMAFGMLIGLGATALVSIRLGEQKKAEAEQYMGNAVTLIAFGTVILVTLGLFFLDPLLKIFGASSEVLPYARDYMSIILYGSIFQTFSFGMNNFMRAEGQPIIAMATMLIGAILNALLAPLFIFVFHWGIRGAALATVSAQAVASIWIASHFIFGRSVLKIRTVNLRLKWTIVKGILSIGIAPCVMQLAQSLLFGIMNNSLLKYGGDIAISGMGIVNSLNVLIFLPIVGFQEGSQPIIGYNYGAKKYDRVKKVLKYAIIAATSIATLGYIVTRLFPVQLISLFNSHDKALLAFGSHALTVYLFCLPVIGFQIIGAGYFQAVGKPLLSMVLNFSRQLLILVPLLLILPHFFRLQGVLMAGPLSDFLAFMLTASFLYLEIKHLTDKHQKQSLMPQLASEEG
jgi:putative MATE family efflux protein